MAEALDTLSNIQRDLGQREQALVSSREAVNLYRELARLNPDVFEPDLAVSLNNLSIHQSAMGKREKALKSIEESVSVYRRLAAERPDTFNVYLAGSLNNLASRQSAVGQRDRALATAHEAVELHRELVRINRDAFLPTWHARSTTWPLCKAQWDNATSPSPPRKKPSNSTASWRGLIAMPSFRI